MTELSARDRALVGLGAALGSNCIPCVEHHLPLARSAGLGDDEIRAALSLADTIRQVPARRVLARATELAGIPAADSAPAAACGTSTPATSSGCGSGPATKSSSGGCC